MASTVRYQFTEAVVTYEEKAREQWLFDYPAQVALATTQIWWTTEVNIAFSRLEEGYENALKDYFKKQVNLSTHMFSQNAPPHTHIYIAIALHLPFSLFF